MATDTAPLEKDWFTAAELAGLALPETPNTQQGIDLLAKRDDWRRPDWQGVRWRERRSRGGGFEYHYSVLSPLASAALLLTLGPKASGAEKRLQELKREGVWRAWAAATEKKKTKALRKAAAVQAVHRLRTSGFSDQGSVKAVVDRFGIPQSTLYRWMAEVSGVHPSDQVAVLAPRHAGRAGGAEINPAAWEWLVTDYLRPSSPNLTDCIRRLMDKNARDAMEWTIPHPSTLQRRVAALDPAMVVYYRQGEDAVMRLYPAQKRDRSMFHALEAINADGHKWDVFVRWPDGTIGRPMMIAFQDLYSGMILSWRVDRSENKEATRLALGDLVEQWGVPSHCWLDNGRGFASKWITGRTPNRYRFKIRDEDPQGVLTALGVQVHWTKPYSGQSKPIERGFRDFAQSIAKHPRFEGAYTGNNPLAKPENYASKAVDLEVFLRTVAESIQEHNSRLGRRSDVCRGRSFAQTFNESYERAPIRKATPEQRLMWLLAGDAVRVNNRDGAITIEGNRYWSTELTPMRGQTVTVRFDPQQLHAPLHVYRMDGVYLGAAECIEAVGFADVSAARAHAQQRNNWLRGLKAMRLAEGRMTIGQLAAAMPVAPEPLPTPESKVVRPFFAPARQTALAHQVVEDEEISEGDTLLRRGLELNRLARGPRLVTDDE